MDPLVGNPDYVLRILDNLISNAIKYSPKNSTVIVSTKQTNSTIQISIRDQGPGISPAEHDKLFKKFSKLSIKPTGNESSTGLGLYIVKKICTTMNGSVRCESEPGCGSTFIVELPASYTRIVPGRPAVKNRRRALG
jgi:signal transduction histidine kinase